MATSTARQRTAAITTRSATSSRRRLTARPGRIRGSRSRDGSVRPTVWRPRGGSASSTLCSSGGHAASIPTISGAGGDTTDGMRRIGSARRWRLILLALLMSPPRARRRAGFRHRGSSVGGVDRARHSSSQDVVAFSDHRNDELVDPGTGLIQFAGLGAGEAVAEADSSASIPAYEEPTVKTQRRRREQDAQASGCTCTSPRRASSSPGPPASIDLARYATLAVPGAHRSGDQVTASIAPADVLPLEGRESRLQPQSGAAVVRGQGAVRSASHRATSSKASCRSASCCSTSCATTRRRSPTSSNSRASCAC